MSTPAVAVVIPCHNAEAWLRETLKSIHAQTLPAAEIVVVDDGSEDRSADIAEELGVRCHRQPCRGPAAARNAGVELAQSPLIAFLDADDRFAPEKLERQVAHLERTGAVLCCSDAWVLEDGRRTRRKNVSREVASPLTVAALLAENPIITSSVVVRRDAVRAAGGFDEDPVLVSTEDYDLWLRIAATGAIEYLDEPLLDYRITPGQLSDDERFLRGIDRIMAKVVDADGSRADAARERRAAVRLDAAYHLARRRQGGLARRRLREARDLGAGVGATWRTWLRSWLG